MLSSRLDSNRTFPSGKMTEVNSTLFVLEYFNARIIHPAPITKIAHNVSNTGCGLTSAAVTSRKLSK